jgi:hypothetical protein
MQYRGTRRQGPTSSNRTADEVILKFQGGVQYGEIVAHGKTTQRPLPLFNSIPYLKEWAAEHPLRPRYGVDNKIPLFVVKHHNKIKRLTPEMLYTYYVYKLNKGWNGGNRHYKGYFRQLLEDPLVAPEDKRIIEALLHKPWNPYIRRHTALTEKAAQLSSALFNQHGGWSATSKMPRLYAHFFGNSYYIGCNSPFKIICCHALLQRNLFFFIIDYYL